MDIISQLRKEAKKPSIYTYIHKIKVCESVSDLASLIWGHRNEGDVYVMISE